MPIDERGGVCLNFGDIQHSTKLDPKKAVAVQKRIDDETRTPGPLLILAALGPFGLGYFFSYLYRAVNAVVAPDLVRDVGLTASQLGLLTSAYLLSFALFQLPLGILLDRFGPRRVQSALVAVGGTGALLFAAGQDVLTLTLARAVIGIGFAGGLMARFKAVVIWVPEPRRALANACVMSLGALGVIVASAPTEWAVRAIGWRVSFVWLGLATLGVAALILLVVPERKTTSRPSGTLKGQIADVGRIYRDPVFLALMPVLAIPAGSHIALQTLWAGPWFRDVAGLDRIAVGQALMVMGAAFLVGVLLSGVVADRLTRRGISLLDVNLGFLAIYFSSLALIILEAPLPPVLLWAVFAMTGHTAVLAYPWISSYFGAELSGRSNTAINLPMFGYAFLVQSAVGWIIDLYPLTASGGYAREGYRMAFGIVLGLQLLTLIWFLVNRRRLRAAEPSSLQAFAIPPRDESERSWDTGPAS
jgi:predicted MFS family arabinose efflux permease